MKIVLIIPTLKQGGAERVMSELANSLVNFSNVDEVHLVLLAEADDFYSIDGKIVVHRLGFVNNGRILKLVAEVKVFFSLRKLLVDVRPDAILSFMEKYNILALAASSFLRLKVFVSDRSGPGKPIPPYISFLRRTFYKYSSGIIAQTEMAKEVLSKTTGSSNIKVINNPLRRVEQFPELVREKIVINVGRLVKEKGQRYLLDAFSQVKDSSWKLVILGNGPLKKDLEGRARELEIGDRVVLPGSVLNVDDWLARSSIFVFPSVSEGFPNALVEAMAAGLPVVSFDCDAGPRDIIEEGINGFLVPVNDVDLLGNRINELIADPDLRHSLGKEAEKVKDKLDRNTIASEYLNFITSNEYTS